MEAVDTRRAGCTRTRWGASGLLPIRAEQPATPEHMRHLERRTFPPGLIHCRMDSQGSRCRARASSLITGRGGWIPEWEGLWGWMYLPSLQMSDADLVSTRL